MGGKHQRQMQEKDKASCPLSLYVSLLTSRAFLLFTFLLHICLAGLCWLFMFLNATLTQIWNRQVVIQAVGLYLFMQSATKCWNGKKLKPNLQWPIHRHQGHHQSGTGALRYRLKSGDLARAGLMNQLCPLVKPLLVPTQYVYSLALLFSSTSCVCTSRLEKMLAYRHCNSQGLWRTPVEMVICFKHVIFLRMT